MKIIVQVLKWIGISLLGLVALALVMYALLPKGRAT